MNILRRFLLCLWSLALMAAAAALGVCAFRPDTAQYVLERSQRLLTASHYFWWLMLAALVLFLLGFVGVFVSLFRKHAPTQVIIGKSDGGQVNISLEAVDNVVRKAALSVNGVKDVKSSLKAASNGVSIGLQITIPHDTSVPETATAIQKEVKEQLQMVAGLTVAEVTVLVSTVEGAVGKTVKDQATIV